MELLKKTIENIFSVKNDTTKTVQTYLFMADFSRVDVDTSFFVGRDVILILNRSEM